MSKYGYVYCIFNTINNKVYYGSTITPAKRRYYHWYNLEHNRHHNRPLQAFVNKYGIKCLYWDILYQGYGYMDVEQDYITKEKCVFNTCMDVYKVITSVSQETREKQRSSRIGKTLTEEHKQNISLGLLGRVVSQKTKDKISNSNKGKKRTEEFRKNCTIRYTGRTMSNTTKEKMRQAKLGKVRTENWLNNNKQAIRKSIAKLDEQKVLEIKYLLQMKMTYKTIANIYNIGQTNVSAIRNEHTWKEISLTEEIKNHFDEINLIKQLESLNN